MKETGLAAGSAGCDSKHVWWWPCQSGIAATRVPNPYDFLQAVLSPIKERLQMCRRVRFSYINLKLERSQGFKCANDSVQFALVE